MLNIRKQEKSEHESEVFINDKLYSTINSFPGSAYFICHKLADFLFLSQHSFDDLILNEVSSIGYKNRDEKDASYYFSYSIDTTYEDPAYLEYIKKNSEMSEVNPEYVNKGNNLSASLSFEYGEWKKLYSILNLATPPEEYKWHQHGFMKRE